MANLIQLLPDHVANQIAAGEVIQRPASVIKELVENAIDAGAGEIRLVVKDAGKTLIQVTDNGCGMNETDARMSFERHATSKIRTADDIFKIFTKGFRGEALASIAAVAQVELKTRQPSSDLGSRLVIEGTEIKLQEPVQCPAGTSFLVKNLFFNVPARRNFLKSENVEFRHILDEFLRVALVHHEVAFRLTHNEQDIFNLPASNARQRIVGVFGKSFNEKLVPVDENTSIARITGFVCKPEHSKKTRGEQYLFVNNRFIRSNYLHHAIAASYDDLIEKGSYPSYFIHLTVDPASIDINIHPTKTEIKFLDEKSLYALVHAAVKQSLGMYNIKPSLDFSSITSFEISPLRVDTEIKAPQITVDPNYNPFRTGNRPVPANHAVKGNPARDWEDLLQIQKEFRAPLEREVSVVEGSGQQEILHTEPAAGNSVYIQIDQRYILSSIKSGIMLIDQKRAHERILYERYLRMLEQHHSLVQSQMFPEQIELSPADYALVADILPMLQAAGLGVELFGNSTIVVNGLPAGSENLNSRSFIEQFIEQIKNFRSDLKFEPREKVALSLARTSCIRRGKKLSMEEMDHLVHELFSCETPHYTPRGKAVIVTFTKDELEKKFD